MTIELLVTLGVFAPLLGAVVAGLFGRRIGDLASQAVTTGLLFFACAMSWTVFVQWTWGGLEPFTVILSPFINVGDFQSNWAIRIDGLSAVMLIVVTTVSALVHLYSWGYMAEDDSRPRFFAYLSLFTFAMLALVTTAGMMLANVPVVWLGERLTRRVPITLVHRISAVFFVVLGLLALLWPGGGAALPAL